MASLEGRHDDKEHDHSGGDLGLPLAGLYGVLLGAGFGGLFGAAFGTLIFPLIGTALGLFFGALTGAVVGLPLGLIDGLLLSWLATAYQNAARPDSRRYQLQARIVCVAGSLLALLTDWALHGLPDPDGFVIYRANGLVLDLFVPVNYTGGGESPEPITLVALGIVVFTPMLMILFASWLTGRFVAGWYAGRICPTRPLVVALSSLTLVLALMHRTSGKGNFCELRLYGVLGRGHKALLRAPGKPPEANLAPERKHRRVLKVDRSAS